MIDGNTAALKQYEKKIDAEDIMFEAFLNETKSNMNDLKKTIRDLYGIVSYYKDEYDYDFEEDLDILIKETLEVLKWK